MNTINGTVGADNHSLNFIQKRVYIPDKEDLKLTSIIILTYNQLIYTKLCIESIRKFTPKGCYEIIVVDNNSTDKTVEWLKEQEDLKVIYNDENKGFPAGCNQGIKISKGDNIILLNNDTIVTPNWLNNLQKALYSSDEIGVVGAITNRCSNYQQVEVPYKNIAQMLDFAENNNISNKDLWEYRTRLIGYCYLVKKSVLDEVGLLDEIFTPGNFEDDDLSFRIICKGYKLLLCKDVFIHHFQSVSFSNDVENFKQVYNANRQKFYDKWGFNSDYSSCIRFDIINHINPDINKEINVLEVGCGIGSSLLDIKNKYKNANIYGIELSEGAGKIVKHLCDAIVGNIEVLELPYEEKFFDYIIFGDVLEHLNDPWEVLKKVKKYLKKDGYILASIPNIMHISVVKMLINGRFPYEDAGILDKTHLRFFTLAEIQNLFAIANYNIETITANAVYISKEDEELINTLCKLSNEGLRQQYMVYQYIIKAKGKEDLSRYENEDMTKLRFKLMRIDNDIDVKESLDYVFEMYEKYKDEFLSDINYLIENHTVNKAEILDKIGKESLNRGLNDLANLLGTK